jgi:hypothetical protein
MLYLYASFMLEQLISMHFDIIGGKSYILAL